MKLWFTLLFSVLIFIPACSVVGAGGGDDDNPYMDWSSYYIQDEAITSSAWGAPEVVGASTPGWEEGVYISPDGNTLYYIYTNIDIFRLFNTGEEKISGPNLDPAGTGMSWETGAGRDCGVYPYADHFYVTRTGENSWSAPQPHFLTTTRMESIGGIHIIENSTRRIAYFMSGFGDGV